MWKRILLGIVGLLVIAVAVAFILPRQVHVERSTIIDVPPSQVFAMVNDFRRFNEWSPWAKRDPDTKYVFTGASSGVSAKMSWTSDHPEVGSGSQEIVESVPDSRVRSSLDFGMDGLAEATFDLKPEGNGTQVTWSLDTDLGTNPIARYFGLMFDSWIGADYEAGLANLKQLAEAS